MTTTSEVGQRDREELLSGIPVTERRLQLAGVSTAVLERGDVPTTLIWGRHDLATPVEIAEAVGARYGWPLHVIEDAGDDPPLEQPAAFLAALHAAISTPTADPISEPVAS